MNEYEQVIGLVLLTAVAAVLLVMIVVVSIMVGISMCDAFKNWRRNKRGID